MAIKTGDPGCRRLKLKQVGVHNKAIDFDIELLRGSVVIVNENEKDKADA